jgi:hypothetical protein
VAWYEVPTVPFGIEAVVRAIGGTVTGAGATAMLIDLLAACGELAESFTCTLKVEVPEAVGVPVMTPV